MSDIGFKGSMVELIFSLLVMLFCLAILCVDVVIFALWISYQWKLYTFEKTYGPMLKFPPRAEDDESLKQAYLSTTSQASPAFPNYPIVPPLSESGASTVEEEEYPPIDPNLLSAQGALRSPFARSWSLVHPFVGIQVIMLGAGILSLLALLPAQFWNHMGMQAEMTSTTYGMVVTSLILVLQNAGFVGITAYFLKGYGTSLQRIGLRAPSTKEIGLGLGLGLALVVLSSALEAGFAKTVTHLVPQGVMDQLTKLNDTVTAGGMFEQIHGVWLKALFIVGGTIAAPIGEEVFFRGLLYNGLKRRWGVLAATLLSALAFGIIHFGPLVVPVIFLMGVVLALAYERTRSLWVTILMHAVNNGVTFGLALYAAKPGH